VALLTLTRVCPSATVSSSGGGSGNIQRDSFGMKRGFRIDWILPTAKDEAAGCRPKQPLFGMAIGPVQERVAPKSIALRRDDPPLGPWPRYRLMLHYRDHSIYTYEVSRESLTGALLII
jgi:hypothetical protein